MGATEKLQSTIIGIFNDVLLFHKFYVSNNFDPLLIKKCLKEVLQNPGNPGLLPLVIEKLTNTGCNECEVETFYFG